MERGATRIWRISADQFRTTGATATRDLLSEIFANHASTSDDDVFGTLEVLS